MDQIKSRWHYAGLILIHSPSIQCIEPDPTILNKWLTLCKHGTFRHVAILILIIEGVNSIIFLCRMMFFLHTRSHIHAFMLRHLHIPMHINWGNIPRTRVHFSSHNNYSCTRHRHTYIALYIIACTFHTYIFIRQGMTDKGPHWGLTLLLGYILCM